MEPLVGSRDKEGERREAGPGEGGESSLGGSVNAAERCEHCRCHGADVA
ncbi:hypothetical protein EMIT0373P_30845 [Pseudomonas chlororaphis]